MSAAPAPVRVRAPALELDGLGELVPIGRPGGQGRVYQPARLPAGVAAGPIALKLYRRQPPPGAFSVLASMVAWAYELPAHQRERLHGALAWPLAILTRGGLPVGIAMRDLRPRFEVAFVMPSGRRAPVLLSLEHLLGADDYLQLRGLDVWLGTTMRVRVAQRLAGALALAHRHGIVVCDIAPNNVLVGFGPDGPEVCLIDCDSMVFRGVRALSAVQTADWQIPDHWGQSPATRSADVYKLGLAVLRLLARSHDARDPQAYRAQTPPALRGLLVRSLAADPANRPPAGEWERALRQLAASGELEHLYPSPAPGRARGVAAAANGSVVAGAATAARGVAASMPAVSGQGASAAAGGAAPRRRSRGSRAATGPLTLAYLVVMAVLLALLISRMLAAVAPGAGTPTVGLGSGPFGGSQGGAQYYYVVPGGQRSAGQGSLLP